MFDTYKFKLKHILIALSAIILLTFMAIAWPFSTNDAGERQVVQHLDGELNVRFDPGWYFAGFFSKVTTWPNNFTIQVSRKKNKSADTDLWMLSDSKDGTFSEGDNAELEHTVKWDLPNNEKQMLDLHQTYNNVNNLMSTTLLSYQKKMASFSSQRMSSEAHYSGGKSQLDEYFSDQLRHGQVLLITETKTRLLKDSTTKTYIEVSPKLNEDGSEMRSVSDIQKFGILATYISMDNVHYDDRIYEKLKSKIDAASEEATSKQELITAQQVALTEKAKGEQLIAKTKATEEAQKMKEVIQAEKLAEVAAQNLITAELNAKATLATKKAQAEGDKLKVDAGLSPLEAANIEKETAIGVAAEISKMNWPEMMIFGGGNGSPTNPFDAVGLEAYKSIVNQMGSKK